MFSIPYLHRSNSESGLNGDSFVSIKSPKWLIDVLTRHMLCSALLCSAAFIFESCHHGHRAGPILEAKCDGSIHPTWFPSACRRENPISNALHPGSSCIE
ncbi:hypothetical protein FVE85_2222 [Porphyridium purpureum]|uniref:Uncharacterized protein n=1 Tax=Porphyridium purpureum TaxID=35688 RepID=A0A5J4Z042_PORPP|nr:hypothetical protein FVE85_2222 [Porphyridium purpureum]|eukprot:POR7923..scf209_3